MADCKTCSCAFLAESLSFSFQTHIHVSEWNSMGCKTGIHAVMVMLAGQNLGWDAGSHCNCSSRFTAKCSQGQRRCEDLILSSLLCSTVACHHSCKFPSQSRRLFASTDFCVCVCVESVFITKLVHCSQAAAAWLLTMTDCQLTLRVTKSFNHLLLIFPNHAAVDLSSALDKLHLTVYNCHGHPGNAPSWL